jgi:hypothetical protein
LRAVREKLRPWPAPPSFLPVLILGVMIGDDAPLARESRTTAPGLSSSPGVSVAAGGGALSVGGVL